MQSHEIHLELVQPDLTDTLFGLQMGERFQPEARSVTEPGPSLLPMALDTGIPGLVWTARYCWELSCWWQLLRNLTADSSWGIRWVAGWERQLTANQGRKDQLHGSMGSSGLNVHPVRGYGHGCLVLWHLSALPRSPTLHLRPLLCNSILQSALLLPKKRPQLQDGWSNRGWFRGGRSGTVR